MHASLNLNEPALLWQNEQWSIGVNYGVCVLGNWPFLPRILLRGMSNLRNLGRQQQSQNVANLGSLFFKENLVSNCTKRNFLNVLTAFLVIK